MHHQRITCRRNLPKNGHEPYNGNHDVLYQGSAGETNPFCACLNVGKKLPITDEYIEREYTIAVNHLMLTSEHTAKEIEQKAKKVMGMLKCGVRFMPTQPNVIAILEKLKQGK